jgi:hypothetical protein
MDVELKTLPTDSVDALPDTAAILTKETLPTDSVDALPSS